MMLITKTNFINHIRCTKMLWLNKHKKKISSEPTESEKLNIAEGHMIGQMATRHPSFQNGYLIETLSPEKAIRETKGVISSKQFETLYEPAIEYNIDDEFSLFLRIDILKMHSGLEVELIEVKSSSSKQEIHLWDIAFQMYVLIKIGYTIKDSWLMKPNSLFIRTEENVDLEDFFITESVYSEVLTDYLPQVEKIVNEIKKSLSEQLEPSVTTGSHCKNPWKCPMFDYCNKGKTEDSVENFTRLTEDKRVFFRNNKIKYINQIDNALIEKYNKETKRDLLSVKQKIQFEVAVTGKTYINQVELKNFINSLAYPLFHLDFEAYNKTVPPYVNMKTNQFVTFQASIHRETESAEIVHSEFLQDDATDPRLKMINFLLLNLEKTGSIIVYCKSFEESRIKELAKNFPEFEKDLLELNDRMVDLEVPFKKWYYNHEFQGSSSIKKVLPVMVPELSYDKLFIKNGADAQSIYRKLLNGDYHTQTKDGKVIKGKKFNKIKKDLLAYCELDTYAMVEILRVLKGTIDE